MRAFVRQKTNNWRLKAISLMQQNNEKLFWKFHNFAHETFCLNKKLEKKERQKYKWNMLLHIRPLARHFSQYTRFTNMNKWKPEVPQSRSKVKFWPANIKKAFLRWQIWTSIFKKHEKARKKSSKIPCQFSPSPEPSTFESLTQRQQNFP